MKNSIILMFIFCGFFATINAQSVVSGRVMDKNAKVPLGYATVMVKEKAAGNPVTGVITNDAGRFTVSGLSHGEYILSVSFIGYKPDSVAILIGRLNNTYDVGDISLDEDVRSLEEIVVTGRADIVSGKLEKKTYNIEDNISQSGGSVLEAMRNLPGVTVDQEGKILLRGSEKVLVLIDGRQSSLTGFGDQKGLDNLSAANIAKIEIVNNPSAKFDAQGMAGIINIIYKQETRTGFNGDAGFSFGVGELTKRKDNLPGIMDKYSVTPKYNPSINLNYRTPKVNLFVQSTGMFRKKVNSNEFTYRTYTDGTDNVNSQFLENRTQQQYNIKFGLDWFINDNNLFTLFGLFEDEYHIDRGHVPYDYSDGTRKRFWTWAEDERTWAMNYSANYKHKFAQAGHVLEATLLYSHGVEDELFPFTDSTAIRNSTDETKLIAKEKITNLNIDYVKPLFSGRIEAGGKMQLRSIPITYKIFPGQGSILDPHLGEWSKYNEDIYAFYANYIFESRYIDIEAGLRAEDAVIKYHIDPANAYYNKNESYDKFSLFPNVRLSFKVADSHKFSLFYNRRVDRPGEFDLRPFPKYDDPEILKTGNPYLRPQFTQLFEAAYKTYWNGGSLFLSGYYKYIYDIFTRIYTTDPASPEIVNAITQNLGKGQNYGMEIVAEHNITKHWNFNAGFNWYRNIIDAFAGEVIYPVAQPFSFNKIKGNTWNLKLNTSAKLPNDFDVQATYVYYAKDIIPQGKVDARGSFDLGIRKEAFGRKAEFSLSATDILNTFAIKETINGQNITLRKENYYETQVVTIGAKYKF